MSKLTYWIPVRTIAATEKDICYECSNCGNHINMYEIEQIRFRNANNREEYEEAIRTQYKMCSKCKLEMNTDITYYLRKLRRAKGDFDLEKVVKEICEELYGKD